ncbi:hypothetical protein [Amycolatopsis viridis]|uniref:DUF998 domain-containing protein n=1 Tax=Amycolatopsis viridis TaxID=185678 RepID=A0ABX0SV79_9PSEU|nr:hypothetical protein [Amycolatopsis viridis]NIH79837.1 hypothetical protein [Amycolatopsis viridis]
MTISPPVARVLAGAGLAGWLVWSMVVESAMPSWFDPGDSCPGARSVERSYFPPSATCVTADGPVEYLAGSTTLLLTVAAVVLAVLTVTGLAVLGFGLLRPAPVSAPGARQPVRHVLGAAALGAAGCAIARVVLLVAVFAGGPPGVITAAVVLVLTAIGAAAALDRACGPGGDPRRRATVLVLTGTAVVAGVVVTAWGDYGADRTGLGPAWTLPLGGVVFAAVAGLQWRPARG